MKGVGEREVIIGIIPKLFRGGFKFGKIRLKAN